MRLGQISALVLPHPMPDWYIQHNLRTTDFPLRVSVIYKKLCNFPRAFSHATLLELHMQIRPVRLFPFYRSVNQHKQWKALNFTMREWTAAHGQERTRMAHPCRGCAPGTLLVPISTGSGSLLCQLSSHDASVSRCFFIHHTCSIYFYIGYKYMSSYLCVKALHLCNKSPR